MRLLEPSELPGDWDPTTDRRLTAWEAVHHLIRALETGGETAAADLVGKLGGKAEAARELAYRLYTVCERKKRAQRRPCRTMGWCRAGRRSHGWPRPQAPAEQASLFENI